MVEELTTPSDDVEFVIIVSSTDDGELITAVEEGAEELIGAADVAEELMVRVEETGKLDDKLRAVPHEIVETSGAEDEDTTDDVIDDVGAITELDGDAVEDADETTEDELWTILSDVEEGVREDTTVDIDMVDISMEDSELELGGGEFVYKFSLSGPPQYSV
ncbi:uncharacterized protein N0V89_001870 [Didymosphaeria variabile]|uniref:Uncharacterized protein n=1 Tax=Didymosphaeria variabile TaxID=1932322 RepID=A0A9W8XQM8_9PLEO|nr:uncharacterized protein N0V89_001870 [Didymosphaeria variabile]KAJ4357295.1 hypothetical protein N0V89_001870 [Didymosphaeria variabile]